MYSTAYYAMYLSVPKVIFLQAAEFSGLVVRPKNYENDPENMFGLFVVLEFKVKKLGSL